MATTKKRRAAPELRMADAPEAVLRRLAQRGDDRALAELARRTAGDKYLRLDAFDGDDAPCHGFSNCCHCPVCEQGPSPKRRRKS